MARGDTGRWVARAAATGGGRTYRGQRPVKWYLSLFLIVVLGIVSVAYSRYERTHTTAAVQPAVGTKWYAAVAFDVCGTIEANLPANPNQASASPGIHTDGDGIIYAEPTKAADAGNNATLERFVELYPGLQLTSSKLKLPAGKALSNGALCPKGTPDAGKAGSVAIKVWPSFSGTGSTHPVVYSDPDAVKLANGQLITVAFVPAKASVPKPSGNTIVTLLNLISMGSSSSTTTPATPTTVAPSPATTAVTPTTAPSPSTTTTK